jgi:hypothetical protein
MITIRFHKLGFGNIRPEGNDFLLNNVKINNTLLINYLQNYLELDGNVDNVR